VCRQWCAATTGKTETELAPASLAHSRRSSPAVPWLKPAVFPTMPVLRGRQGTSLPRTVHAAHICIAFVSIFVLFLAQPAEPLRLPGADDIRRWLRRGTAETASDSAWGAEVFGRPLLSQRSEVDPVAQRILASGAYGGSGSNGRANADALSTVFDAAALDQLQGQALSDARRTAPDAATTAAAYTSAASSGAFDLERASMLATLQSIAYCGDQVRQCGLNAAGAGRTNEGSRRKSGGRSKLILPASQLLAHHLDMPALAPQHQHLRDYSRLNQDPSCHPNCQLQGAPSTHPTPRTACGRGHAAAARASPVSSPPWSTLTLTGTCWATQATCPP
jgi:hypothetical protein